MSNELRKKNMLFTFMLKYERLNNIQTTLDNIGYAESLKRMSSKAKPLRNLVNEMLTSDINKFLSNIIS